METEAIFQMVEEVCYGQGYSIGTIINDDDLTMQANFKHSFNEKNTGWIDETKRLATNKQQHTQK